MSPIERIELDRAQCEHLNWRSSRVDDLNARGATFKNCDFSYSIFTRAYCHGAKFINCDFTGARFYDCNFRTATFYQCDVKYALFYRSIVEIDELVATLPLEPNLRRDSIRNLRANEITVGKFENQKLLVLQEVAANISHWSMALHGADNYYRQKYPALMDKVRAWLNLARLRISGLVWGHGERPARILVSGLIILLTLSLLNFWSVMPREGWLETRGGLRIIERTFALLLGLPTDSRFKGYIGIDYVIVMMRYVYIGLYISVLSKTVSHR